MKQLQVCDFVEWELQKFRDECNFTDEELEVFELKARNKSNEYIAQNLHISLSKTNRLIKRIKTKIIKVI